MNILIVSPFENTTTKRGNRNLLIYNKLIELGHNVDYLTSNFDHALKSNICNDKFNFEMVINVRGYESNLSVSRLLTHLEFVIKSRKKLAKNHYDVVFLSSIPPELGFIIPKKRAKKIILDVRDIWPDALLGYDEKLGIKKKLVENYFHITNKIFMNKVDEAIIVATGYKSWLDRYSIKKFSFLPLGFRNEKQCSSASTDRKYNNKALYAGGLTPQFDISNMALKLSKFGIQVDVYGSGDLEEKYKSIPNIKLQGVVSREYVQAMMNKAKYLLFPNNRNALLPNKAFDYYMSNVDVIFEENVSLDVKKLFSNIKPWKGGLYISEYTTRDKVKCDEYGQGKIVDSICKIIVDRK